jgi:GH43 family beta-xylosidase
MQLLPLLAAAFVGLASLASAASFTNPLKNPNGSDPHIVYTGGYYYLTTTTWTNIQLTRATTIAGLKTATPTTVWTDSTASRAGNFWAPGTHLRRDPSLVVKLNDR